MDVQVVSYLKLGRSFETRLRRVRGGGDRFDLGMREAEEFLQRVDGRISGPAFRGLCHQEVRPTLAWSPASEVITTR
jgi:hypothetical protein